MFSTQNTRSIDLRLPRSWNECTTEQLELISRVMLEQIERVDRYHPFDMRNVKLACFFLFAGVEIVNTPDPLLPIERQCYMCRMAFDRPRRMRLSYIYNIIIFIRFYIIIQYPTFSWIK